MRLGAAGRAWGRAGQPGSEAASRPGSVESPRHVVKEAAAFLPTGRAQMAEAFVVAGSCGCVEAVRRASLGAFPLAHACSDTHSSAVIHHGGQAPLSGDF